MSSRPHRSGLRTAAKAGSSTEASRARRDRSSLTPATRSSSSPLWPCLSSHISVGVDRLRNLTGEPDWQALTESFNEKLVSYLLRHGRGFSLRQLGEPTKKGEAARSAELEPGCKYIVAGSGQRGEGGSLRVNIRITDADTTEYLWARRYHFGTEGREECETTIIRDISQALHLRLLRHVIFNASSALGGEYEPQQCLSSAAAALEGELRAELTSEAQQWFLTALATDPQNVEALTGLARTCQHLVSNPWWAAPHTPFAASDFGREAIAIALSLAPGHADAHCVQGMLYSAAGQLEDAAGAFEQALAMDQGLAIAHGFAGYNAALLGRAHETLPAIGRAMRLDPAARLHSIWFFFGGFAELLVGRVDLSIALFKQSLERNPSYGSALLFLMAALSSSGRSTEAAEVAEAFRHHYPECPAVAFENLWLSRSACANYRARIWPLFEKIRELGVAN
jgi:tetratricopeptide (TPR) repeat protein/TolB-like protein